MNVAFPEDMFIVLFDGHAIGSQEQEISLPEKTDQTANVFVDGFLCPGLILVLQKLQCKITLFASSQLLSRKFASNDLPILRTKQKIWEYIEDIYFFEVNTKYILSNVLKTFSQVRSIRQFSQVIANLSGKHCLTRFLSQYHAHSKYVYH